MMDEKWAYRLRTNDGASDPWSAFYWIDQDGSHGYMPIEFHGNPSPIDQPKRVRYPNSVLITVQNPELSKNNIDCSLYVAARVYWCAATTLTGRCCWVYNEADVCIGKAY